MKSPAQPTFRTGEATHRRRTAATQAGPAQCCRAQPQRSPTQGALLSLVASAAAASGILLLSFRPPVARSSHDRCTREPGRLLRSAHVLRDLTFSIPVVDAYPEHRNIDFADQLSTVGLCRCN